MRQQSCGMGRCCGSRTVCTQHVKAAQQLDNRLFSFCFIKHQTDQSGLQCRSHQKAREIQEVERVFTQVRKQINKAQEERCNRTGRTNSAGFPVGDSATFKLQPGQRTLGKLHAYKSAIYEVVSCSRNNSYRIKPYGRPGLILQRNFNELERAPHQVLRRENTPPCPPSGFSSDDEGVPPSVPARNGTGQ